MIGETHCCRHGQDRRDHGWDCGGRHCRHHVEWGGLASSTLGNTIVVIATVGAIIIIAAAVAAIIVAVAAVIAAVAAISKWRRVYQQFLRWGLRWEGDEIGR